MNGSQSANGNINPVFRFPPTLFAIVGWLPVESGHYPVESGAAWEQEIDSH